MQELWGDLADLRKHNMRLYPVIRIQKVFRGWLVRRRLN